ncbi:hypothetical protein ACQW02_13125 [Humitalea sp. 24SJ18S-53]|uniref:hypothetical protein n=1 Tax=Humitalea sp. 24SJ18S-53 TaxID=3422307 RepID=UPI003D66E36C
MLIATVEKPEALMRFVGHLLVLRPWLPIIDEAHQLVTADCAGAQDALASHSRSAIRLEAMVTRLLAIKHDMGRIALTVGHPVSPLA